MSHGIFDTINEVRKERRRDEERSRAIRGGSELKGVDNRLDNGGHWGFLWCKWCWTKRANHIVTRSNIKGVDTSERTPPPQYEVSRNTVICHHNLQKHEKRCIFKALKGHSMQCFIPHFSEVISKYNLMRNFA
jgi:hypothetical protein